VIRRAAIIVMVWSLDTKRRFRCTGRSSFDRVLEEMADRRFDAFVAVA
jgi:hypothetical protein